MDKNLEFMKELDNEQITIFVETMLNKGDITEMLTVSDEYKKYGKDYSKYIERIIEEFLDFGSNTLWFRKTYKEVLIDVADKLKVNFNKEQNVENIETKILEKVLVEAWKEMSEADKKELVELAKDKYGKIDIKAEGSLALLTAFRAGGFASYKLTLIIVNAIAKAVLGRGLSLAANAGLTRVLGILAGPIGIAATALWTAVDIGGPAYRVTIPCTILIAAFRHEIELKKHYYLETKKEMIIRNNEELREAIENKYDSFLVEGELAENLRKINKIKELTKIDILSIVVALAAFCAPNLLKVENPTVIANKFFTTSQIFHNIRIEKDGNVYEIADSLILAITIILMIGIKIGMDTMIDYFKNYNYVECNVDGVGSFKCVRKGM